MAHLDTGTGMMKSAIEFLDPDEKVRAQAGISPATYEKYSN